MKGKEGQSLLKSVWLQCLYPWQNLRQQTSAAACQQTKVQHERADPSKAAFQYPLASIFTNQEKVLIGGKVAHMANTDAREECSNYGWEATWTKTWEKHSLLPLFSSHGRDLLSSPKMWLIWSYTCQSRGCDEPACGGDLKMSSSGKQVCVSLSQSDVRRGGILSVLGIWMRLCQPEGSHHVSHFRPTDD